MVRLLQGLEVFGFIFIISLNLYSILIKPITHENFFPYLFYGVAFITLSAFTIRKLVYESNK